MVALNSPESYSLKTRMRCESGFSRFSVNHLQKPSWWHPQTETFLPSDDRTCSSQIIDQLQLLAPVQFIREVTSEGSWSDFTLFRRITVKENQKEQLLLIFTYKRIVKNPWIIYSPPHIFLIFKILNIYIKVCGCKVKRYGTVNGVWMLLHSTFHWISFFFYLNQEVDVFLICMFVN